MPEHTDSDQQMFTVRLSRGNLSETTLVARIALKSELLAPPGGRSAVMSRPWFTRALVGVSTLTLFLCSPDH